MTLNLVTLAYVVFVSLIGATTMTVGKPLLAGTAIWVKILYALLIIVLVTIPGMFVIGWMSSRMYY